MTFAVQLIDGKSLLIQDYQNSILIGGVESERFEALYEAMTKMRAGRVFE